MNATAPHPTLAALAAAAASSTTRIPINTTLPPEQYRFIPGSTPTFTMTRNITGKLKVPPFNSTGTGYYIETEETETGFNEIQTLFLACFATLLPLVVILVTAFTIRILWRRYKRGDCLEYDGDNQQELGSSQENGANAALHHHLLHTTNKLEDTHISTDNEICGGVINNSIKGNSHANTNGSIITMTLKNNHLIVETEERNDLEEDSRETTMKYSPSARDGVFVVEVQQGVKRSPSNTTKDDSQCALVHQPPPDKHPQQPNELSICKTGLAQSTQSLATPSYTYGNQQEYDNGCYGYPAYPGYVNDEPAQRLPDVNKPKITSAVYKSVNGGLRGQGSLDLLADGPLLSDLNMRRKDDQDAIQREQSRLGNQR